MTDNERLIKNIVYNEGEISTRKLKEYLGIELSFNSKSYRNYINTIRNLVSKKIIERTITPNGLYLKVPSSFVVYINPNQNVLATGKIEIEVHGKIKKHP